MRSEIAKLHAKLQTTFIYVTHDQIEAMTMGTRIVVMKNGFVQQIDSPKNLYNYPGNKFVAGFIGTPQMNFFEGTLLKKGDEVEINFEYSEAKITVPYSMMYKAKPSYLDGKSRVYIGLRAESVSINPEVVKASKSKIKVRVSHKEELGNQTLVYGDINMQGDGYTESSTRIIINMDAACDFKAGDIIDAALDITKVHLFDKETEVSILPRIPEFNYLDCEVNDGKIIFLGTELKLPPAIKCENGKYELLIPTDAITTVSPILPQPNSLRRWALKERLPKNFTTNARRTIYRLPKTEFPRAFSTCLITARRNSPCAKQEERPLTCCAKALSRTGQNSCRTLKNFP